MGEESGRCKPLVRIVDDSPELLESLEFLLRCEGYDVAAYKSAKDFLQSDAPSRPGCLILDVQMPGMTGLELQQLLNARESMLPVIFLTAHGSVDMAVSALHEGAVDFEQKPIRIDRFLPAVARAVEHDLKNRGCLKSDGRNLSRLTERERNILRAAAFGSTSRQIAKLLGLSARTVEHHRAAALRKLNLRSAAEAAVFFLSESRQEAWLSEDGDE